MTPPSSSEPAVLYGWAQRAESQLRELHNRLRGTQQHEACWAALDAADACYRLLRTLDGTPVPPPRPAAAGALTSL